MLGGYSGVGVFSRFLGCCCDVVFLGVIMVVVFLCCYFVFVVRFFEYVCVFLVFSSCDFVDYLEGFFLVFSGGVVYGFCVKVFYFVECCFNFFISLGCHWGWGIPFSFLFLFDVLWCCERWFLIP